MGSFKKSCLTNWGKILKFADLKMRVLIFSGTSCIWKILSISSLLLINDMSAYFEVSIELLDYLRY